MNPPQLRHTDMQCGAETDRRAQQARHRHLPKQLEAFLTARDAYTAARHRHSQALAAEALALGRGLSALVAAAAEPQE